MNSDGQASAAAPMSLFATHSKPVNPNRRRGHAAAEFEIASDFGNVFEQLFQISGDRDLFDGIGEFAVDDPEPGSAARVIAGDQIRAVTEEFGDGKAFFNLANNLLRGFRSRLQKVIAGRNSGSTGESAGSVGGS